MSFVLPTREAIDIEFKEAKTDLPTNLFDSVCAFLNTDGGTIYLGVGDDGVVSGVNPDAVMKLKKAIASISNNPQKLNPPYLLFPVEEIIDGKVVIILQVPLSSQVHKHHGAIFLRSEDGDYRVSGNHQLAGLLNRKLGIFSEQTPIPRIRIGDLRSDLFERARELMRMQNQDHTWLTLDNQTLLQTAGLYTRDGAGEPALSLAAILLFGTDEVIQQAAPAYKFDCLLRRQSLDRYDDRLEIYTNLIDAYDLMMGFVRKHLNDPFYLEGDIRVSLRERIFREAISNIISHREYRHASPARLMIYSDKVVMDNPSMPYFHSQVTPENLKSHPKNPSLCKFMIQLGRFEQLGSGVINIHKYLPRYSGGAKPIFHDSPNGFELILPLLSPESGAESGAESGVESGAESVSLQNRIIEALADEELSKSDIASKLNMQTISGALNRAMKQLVLDGTLEYTIPGKPNSRLQKYRLADDQTSPQPLDPNP